MCLMLLLDQKAAASDGHMGSVTQTFTLVESADSAVTVHQSWTPKKSKDANECFTRPLAYIAREVNRRQYLLMSILCICNAQRSIAIHRQWQERSQQQARNRGGRQYQTSIDTLVSWYWRPVLAFHKLLTCYPTHPDMTTLFSQKVMQK